MYYLLLPSSWLAVNVKMIDGKVKLFTLAKKSNISITPIKLLNWW